MFRVFKPSMAKEGWAKLLVVPLYLEGYIETMWNTRNELKRSGWKLKSGLWSPWFFNMRPVGSSPALFHNICTAMAEMIITEGEVDMLIGVEMAGITSAGAISRAMYDFGFPVKVGYTRPLPRKVKTPQECLNLINEIDGTVADYSEKEYVEGRLEPGMSLAILDDMATDLGSKIIARNIVLWQAGLRGADVTCNDVYYFLNRSKGNVQKGVDFAEETNPELHPAPLKVHYVLEIDDYLSQLNEAMKPEEFEIFMRYQSDPGAFQGVEGEENRQHAIFQASLGA